MKQMNWEEIHGLANRKATLKTKTHKSFQIVSVTDNALTVQVSSKEFHTVSRSNLEKAVMKLQAGVILDRPKDYREEIADDRPTYAWAILRELGYIK